MPRYELLADWLLTPGPIDIATMWQALLDCLTRLHHSGGCHRNVHERNVVVDGLRPLLIDFQLAVDVEPTSGCFDLCGPASRVAVPQAHSHAGINEVVWWDSPTPHVRCIWHDFGPLSTYREEQQLS